MPNSFSEYKRVLSIDMNLQIYAILLRPEIQREIIEYNQSQLSEGIDSRGEKIITKTAEFQRKGNVYAINTIAIRAEEGLQTINVDLNFSGQFWSTFKVVVNKDSFEVVADYNSPGEDIRRNFDNDYEFLGVTQDNLESFVWLVLYRELEKDLPGILIEKSKRFLN